MRKGGMFEMRPRARERSSTGGLLLLAAAAIAP